MIEDAWVNVVRRAFGFQEPVSAVRCVQGFENGVYRFATGHGVWAVRVYERRSTSEVEFEARVLNSLAFAELGGVRVPLLYSSPSGECILDIGGHPCIAYPWIDGSPVTAMDICLIRELVRFIADLQSATSEIVALHTSRPSWDTLAVEERAEILLNKDLDCEFDWAASLDWHRRSSDYLRVGPRVVVHGDLNPTNILLSPDSRLRAVLDFDDCYIGSAVADLSSLLMHASIDQAGRIDLDRVFAILPGLSDGGWSREEGFTAIGCAAFKYLVYVVHTDMTCVGRVRSASVRTKYARVVKEARRYLGDPAAQATSYR